MYVEYSRRFGQPGSGLLIRMGGRVNAHKAVSILENGNYLLDSVSPGATNTHTLNVPSGVEERFE